MSASGPLAPFIGQEFPTMNDCRIFTQAFAKQSGYAIGTDYSNNNKGNLKLVCVHHGRYRKGRPTIDNKDKDVKVAVTNVLTETPAIKRRDCKTRRLGCPTHFFFYRGPDKTKNYRLTRMLLEHNHSIALNLSIYPVHRKLDDEQKARVVQMVSAKIAPRMIVNLMNEEGHHLIAKDIANLKTRQ